MTKPSSELERWARQHARALWETVDEEADAKLAAQLLSGKGKSGRRLLPRRKPPLSD